MCTALEVRVSTGYIFEAGGVYAGIWGVRVSLAIEYHLG